GGDVSRHFHDSGDAGPPESDGRNVPPDLQGAWPEGAFAVARDFRRADPPPHAGSRHGNSPGTGVRRRSTRYGAGRVARQVGGLRPPGPEAHRPSACGWWHIAGNPEAAPFRKPWKILA